MANSYTTFNPTNIDFQRKNGELVKQTINRTTHSNYRGDDIITYTLEENYISLGSLNEPNDLLTLGKDSKIIMNVNRDITDTRYPTKIKKDSRIGIWLKAIHDRVTNLTNNITTYPMEPFYESNNNYLVTITNPGVPVQIIEKYNVQTIGEYPILPGTPFIPVISLTSIIVNNTKRSVLLKVTTRYIQVLGTTWGPFNTYDPDLPEYSE